MNMVVTPEHKQLAGRLRELMAKYQEVELLVKIGEYKRGSDAIADQAIDRIDKIHNFLKQSTDEYVDFDQMLAMMKKTVS
jgi:type III secretion protein N (ATPase)